MLNHASRGILLSLYKPRANFRRFSSFSFKDPNRISNNVHRLVILNEKNKYEIPFSPSRSRLFDNVFIARNFSISFTKCQEEQSPVSTGSSSKELGNTDSNEILVDFLPEKPVPIEGLSDDTVIKYVGDPPFEALGLASWWPPGRFQYFMEQLHVGLDLPWWGTIIAMTALLRLVTFPAVVLSQRNAAKMGICMPKMQELQAKMADARSRGDVYDSAKYGMELQEYMTKHKINPLKNLIPMMFQFPFFMSMFVGLRGMANLPVESMCHGGLGWFTDLSISDPFYLLPAATATTLFFQLKLGADGMNFNQVGPVARGFLKYGLPAVVFVATMNFPAAVTFYWFTTNIISVCQAKVIRTKSIRKKLGIPKFKTPKEKLPSQSKGFMEGMRESEYISSFLSVLPGVPTSFGQKFSMKI